VCDLESIQSEENNIKIIMNFICDIKHTIHCIHSYIKLLKTVIVIMIEFAESVHG
jgi:hypothetical protein